MKKLAVALGVVGMTLAPLAFPAVNSVVLVHGAFADGSWWKPVAGALSEITREQLRRSNRHFHTSTMAPKPHNQ